MAAAPKPSILTPKGGYKQSDGGTTSDKAKEAEAAKQNRDRYGKSNSRVIDRRTPAQKLKDATARSTNPQLGGTGPDADGGKGRTQFEDDRRQGNAGGKDRPPIYKPQDDGERGGYINRNKKIIPAPGKSKLPATGSSIVKGMVR